MPFYIRTRAELSSYELQRPVGYHVRIVSNDYYVTVDDIGHTKTINPGDSVYSKYFDTSETLIVEMSADNVDLESGMTYTVYCSIDMSTGLTVTNDNNPHEFDVSWIDVEHVIDTQISVDKEAYTALITPYCSTKRLINGTKNMITYPYYNTTVPNLKGGLEWIDNGDGSILVDGEVPEGTDGATMWASFVFTKELDLVSDTYYSFSSNSGRVCLLFNYIDENNTSRWIAEDKSVLWKENYTFGSLYVQFQSGDVLDNVVIRPQFEIGKVSTSYEPYTEIYDLVENVTLSVYRREYDGSYKEIATGIPNNYTAVTDPHPALDYARYRFVAKDTLTGAVSFYDMAGYPVGGHEIVLQWAEEWSTFDTGESTSVEGPSWTGSILKLPYNIKTNDSRKTEVALVNYAGRKHPVSYYGTQVDEASQWSVEIPKDDKETIYALRRLSLWADDVYIREPSGMGYWANVVVSFNQTFNEVTIPVTLDITRVEGGV